MAAERQLDQRMSTKADKPIVRLVGKPNPRDWRATHPYEVRGSKTNTDSETDRETDSKTDSSALAAGKFYARFSNFDCAVMSAVRMRRQAFKDGRLEIGIWFEGKLMANMEEILKASTEIERRHKQEVRFV